MIYKYYITPILSLILGCKLVNPSCCLCLAFCLGLGSGILITMMFVRHYADALLLPLPVVPTVGCIVQLGTTPTHAALPQLPSAKSGLGRWWAAKYLAYPESQTKNGELHLLPLSTF